jgi:hypothetical protein
LPTAAIVLQRLHVLIDIAGAGAGGAQFIADLGKRVADRIPGSVPLCDVERPRFRREFFRPGLREADHHRLLGAKSVDGHLPAFAVGAQRPQTRLDGAVIRLDVAWRDTRLNRADHDFFLRRAGEAEGGRIERIGQVPEDEREIAGAEIDLGDARHRRRIRRERHGIDPRLHLGLGRPRREGKRKAGGKCAGPGDRRRHDCDAPHQLPPAALTP